MPGLSTHITFGRLVLERTAVQLDKNYYLLGCVTPDCVDLNNVIAFSQSHFTSSDKVPDLSLFLNSVNLVFNRDMASRDSFLYGYFSHLWLDRYIQEHGQKLRPVDHPGLSEGELLVIFKNNMRRYDRNFIKNFISVFYEEDYRDVVLFPFILRELIFTRLSEILNFSQGPDQDCITVILEDHYMNFLINASDIFLKQYLTG